MKHNEIEDEYRPFRAPGYFSPDSVGALERASHETLERALKARGRRARSAFKIAHALRSRCPTDNGRPIEQAKPLAKALSAARLTLGAAIVLRPPADLDRPAIVSAAREMMRERTPQWWRAWQPTTPTTQAKAA